MEDSADETNVVSNDTPVTTIETNALSKRERKPTVLFSVESAPKSNNNEEIKQGLGINLADNDHFCKQLERVKTSDSEVLRLFHTLLYGREGKKSERKKYLKKFSGFPEGSDPKKYIDIVTNRKSFTVSILKEILGLLGLEKGGTREDLIEKLVGYLSKPYAVKQASKESKPKKDSKKRKLISAGDSDAKSSKRKNSVKSADIFGDDDDHDDIFDEDEVVNAALKTDQDNIEEEPV